MGRNGLKSGMKESVSIEEGEGTKIEDCTRGISLTPALYKVYASVLANKLRKEVEKKVLFYRIKRVQKESKNVG